MTMQNVTQQDRELARAVARAIGRVVEVLHNSRVVTVPAFSSATMPEGTLDVVANSCADVLIRRLEQEAVNFD